MDWIFLQVGSTDSQALNVSHPVALQDYVEGTRHGKNVQKSNSFNKQVKCHIEEEFQGITSKILILLSLLMLKNIRLIANNYITETNTIITVPDLTLTK